jgi:hypothetical protein
MVVRVIPHAGGPRGRRALRCNRPAGTVGAPRRRMKTQNDLLDTLFVELFQTERSALVHPEREAERYGDAPPAHALRAVANHAREQLPTLEELAALDGRILAKVGMAIGETLSLVRETVADRLVSREKSYRGTLLGMHHGVDLVHEVREVAALAARRDVVIWCEQWLATREPLVQAVRGELDWFARNPDVAAERPGLRTKARSAGVQAAPGPTPSRETPAAI